MLTIDHALQRIRTWLNNNTGARNASLHPRIRISRRNNPIDIMLAGGGAMAAKPKQMLQPKQAFSVKYWEPQLKAIVTKEWEAKVKEDPMLAKKRGRRR